ncbi:IclR family transcriptional regulator [Rhodococcus sp. HM1]|uniref:IclR family transcriptional regulator n=1 Tax=unclassified Rhodococcus (in: high G+C Gram-positive bacteria) TaxID=192944 RepID=UPI0018CFAA78|nr:MULTISPECIES: IclR family transcriptional regulator [unclassified Rhodococcus (in: high G+C Gram-positive bacteria)]MBH0119755.1 IclR family transcriptional regulator [Rhodococcus sp. CX]MCK8674947.1 IclR family transcriptional regulator [Rhodococcus sp. HM1]
MSQNPKFRWNTGPAEVTDPGRPGADPRESPLDMMEMTSVEKALSVLDSFRGRIESLGVTEVAEANGLPKSTAYRLLSHMVASGLLERDGRKYRPSWQIFELAQSSILGRVDGPVSLARPLMTELYVETRGVVHFGVRRGNEVMVVEKIFGPDSVALPTRVGARLPLTTTALGKALLAEQIHIEGRDAIPAPPLLRLTRNSLTSPQLLVDQLARTRALGYTVDREETVLGVSCVGAVVMRGRRPIGALSVSVRSVGFDEAKLSKRVVRYARMLSNLLVSSEEERDDEPRDRTS